VKDYQENLFEDELLETHITLYANENYCKIIVL